MGTPALLVWRPGHLLLPPSEGREPGGNQLDVVPQTLGHDVEVCAHALLRVVDSGSTSPRSASYHSTSKADARKGFLTSQTQKERTSVIVLVVDGHVRDCVARRLATLCMATYRSR